MNFDPFIDRVILREGDFVDHPSDRGGPTRWGITEARARDEGYMGPMRDLPQDLARRIYKMRYITTPRFDLVAPLSEPIAAELIDSGINMGPSVPSLYLQRWLNGFNSRGSKYADIFVDGRVGKHTIDALAAFLKWRGKEGEAVMLAALNGLQASDYLGMAENRETQEDFLYGWVRGRVLERAM